MSARRRVTAAAVLAVGLVACGGGDATRTAADSAAETVDIDDFAFDPGMIAVPVGTTVTWTNRDATDHTVTAGTADDPDTERFDLPVSGVDDEVSVAFDEPGTVTYHCVLHPFMTGTIQVEG